MSRQRTILVLGATGGQGGVVARRLLDHGWAVRALVRDAAAPAARALGALGAELVVGDLDEPASLRAAAGGAYGIFGALPADLTDPRPEVEVRRGRHVVEAAGAAGVAHLVYSSVAAAHQGSGVVHFETKTEIEAHLAASGVPATVLRPTFLMENWRYLLPAAVHGARVCRFALGPDTPLQMVALADVGRIAVDAFERPAVFLGTALDLAGDELTPRRIAEVLTEVDGVPVRFTRQPLAELAAAGDLAAMYRWLDAEGYRVDIPALRRRYPELRTLAAWRREA